MATSKTDTGELFLSRLSETYICRPGDNVLLECYVYRQRVKLVQWYANGELVEERGFRVWHRYQAATGQCTLYIRSVLYSDGGSYCCEATSLDDTVETLEIKIEIDNSDKSWTKIPILHMAGHVVTEDTDESNPFSLNYQKSTIDENMFPIQWYELRIDRPLLDPTILIENNPLQLSCRIAGLHIDKFEWFRNGELIAVCNETPPSSVITTITGDVDRGLFHATYDTLPAHFIALLTVDRATKQRHEGTYECHASNAHYHVSSSCNIIINEIEQESLSSDQAISSRASSEIRKRTDDERQERLFPFELKRLRMDETAFGQHFQSHQPITTSPVESQFRIIGDQIVPSMKAVKWNEKFQTFHQKKLPTEHDISKTVPSSDDESSSVSAGDLEQILRSHSLLATEKNLDPGSSSDTGNELSGMYPVFFQLLPSNIECEEGERLLLSCQVMAGTPCQIKWFINNTIILENQYRTRRHYNPDTGICFIIIDPTFTTDSGTYRLIISNRYGQAQSTCQVQILTRQLPAMPEDDLSTRLHFIKPLSSTPITCRDGDTIQLTCIVHGKRPIDIRWYKDEEQILITDRQQHTHQIHFDSLTGKCTLIIHDIYPSDGGIYRCEATNEQGKQSTTTMVDVAHYQYEVDSEISSVSFASGPPSDYEDIIGTQSHPSIDTKALYEESRRLVQELDARTADLSSGTITTIRDEHKPGKVYFF